MYLGTGIGLLKGGAGAQSFPGLVLAHWEMEVCSWVSGCNILGVLELVLACSWVGCVLIWQVGWAAVVLGLVSATGG